MIYLLLFNKRILNYKTNNYIFTGIDDLYLLDSIPEITSISYPDNDINIDYAINIKIDLKDEELKDVLTYVLEALKKLSLLPVDFDWTIDFHSKYDLLKFQGVLRRFNVSVQIIFYNVEKLSLEEQVLFNEIYYFNSMYFNVNSFIKGDNFQSYFLSGDRVLDDRENYEKIRLICRQVDGELKRNLIPKE